MANNNGYPEPHKMHGMAPLNTMTPNPYGANPPPGWSQHVGPEHKAPPPVATQLVVPSDLHHDPSTLTCFNCQEHITTSTRTYPSIWAWLSCLGVCIFLPCLCLCAPIPFCVPSCKNTDHYCPNCEIKLGKYKGQKDLPCH